MKVYKINYSGGLYDIVVAESIELAVCKWIDSKNVNPNCASLYDESSIERLKIISDNAIT